MSLTITPTVLNAHAMRVATYFAPGRKGISDAQLKDFYVWLDGVIGRSADGYQYSQSIVLDNVAFVSTTIANLVCNMHEDLPRRDFNFLVMDKDDNAVKVIRKIMEMYSERDSQLVCDSLLHLVKYAKYEDEGSHDANSRINTAEMLFEKLDPEIVGHVKASRPNIPVGSAD